MEEIVGPKSWPIPTYPCLFPHPGPPRQILGDFIYPPPLLLREGQREDMIETMVKFVTLVLPELIERTQGPLQ